MAVSRKRLLAVWETARTSYWLAPGLMTAAGAALAFLMVQLDQAAQARGGLPQVWFFVRGDEEARAVLSTIASSMITVTALVFSLTIVALALASQQYGPRLLRGFRSDPAMKLALGTFVATFVYCLLVLQAAGGDEVDGGAFVPRLAVAAALLLTLLSIGVLIFFIHHLASEIQAESILAAVAHELDAVVDRMFPEVGEGVPERPGAAGLPPDSALTSSLDSLAAALAVRSRRDGYVQVVDDDTLMTLAEAHDLVVRLERRPGDFVVAGETLAHAWPKERATEVAGEAFEAAFVLGRHRTPPQDPEFGVTQLVEVGMRALSPGINDPFTAVACVDRLTQSLARLAQRPFPLPCRHDGSGRLRLVAQPQTFAQVLAAGFDPLFHHGRSEPMVVARLFQALATIGARTADEARRDAVRAQADRLLAEAGRELPDGPERAAAAAGHAAVLAALDHPADGTSPLIPATRSPGSARRGATSGAS
jgi:uncharacterized membrane protein